MRQLQPACIRLTQILSVFEGRLELAEIALKRASDSIFKTRAKNATLRTEDVKIRFIRPDVAITHVTNELSGLVTPDGQTLSPQKELSMRVFVKEGGNGEWPHFTTR